MTTALACRHSRAIRHEPWDACGCGYPSYEHDHGCACGCHEHNEPDHVWCATCRRFVTVPEDEL